MFQNLEEWVRLCDIVVLMTGSGSAQSTFVALCIEATHTKGRKGMRGNTPVTGVFRYQSVTTDLWGRRTSSRR